MYQIIAVDDSRCKANWRICNRGSALLQKAREQKDAGWETEAKPKSETRICENWG